MISRAVTGKRRSHSSPNWSRQGSSYKDKYIFSSGTLTKRELFGHVCSYALFVYLACLLGLICLACLFCLACNFVCLVCLFVRLVALFG